MSRFFRLYKCLQDDDIYLSAIERDATASAVCALKKSAAPSTAIRSNDSSDDENDTDDGTISGENDVEYAEFSLSVRTSPKEQIVNRNGNASTASDELNNMPRSQKPKRSTATMDAGQQPNNDFMIMPMASERNDISMPSNLPGSPIVKLFNCSCDDISLILICFQPFEIAIVHQSPQPAYWRHCLSRPNRTKPHHCWPKHFCPAAVHRLNPAQPNRCDRLNT